MSRGRRLLAAAFVAAAAVVALGAPAAAQDDGPATTAAPADGPRLVATIAVDDPPEPLEGVEMVVRRDGDEVGRAASDAEGFVAVGLPGGGEYEVTLDLDTLPEGVSVAPGAPEVLRPLVQTAGDRPVIFRLVEGDGGGGVASSGPSRTERFANLLASGLRFGLVIALAAVGLSIIYGTTGLTNFAHGELVTIGAVATWYFNSPDGGLGMALVPAALLGVLVAAVVGGLLEVGMFGPLRRRGTPALSAMVISIGLAFLLRYLINIVFGANPRQYAQYAAQSPSVTIGPVDLRPKDVIVAAVAAAMLVAVGLFLSRARLGTAIRAVSDDRDLSESSGIDVRRVTIAVWVLAAGLAGLGGALLGSTEAVSWNMGQRALLIMFAAVVLGGLGTTFGAMAGGVFVGVVSDLSTYWLDPDLKIVVALGILIIVLLFRPQGIFGVQERRA